MKKYIIFAGILLISSSFREYMKPILDYFFYGFEKDLKSFAKTYLFLFLIFAFLLVIIIRSLIRNRFTNKIRVFMKLMSEELKLKLNTEDLDKSLEENNNWYEELYENEYSVFLSKFKNENSQSINFIKFIFSPQKSGKFEFLKSSSVLYFNIGLDGKFTSFIFGKKEDIIKSNMNNFNDKEFNLKKFIKLDIKYDEDDLDFEVLVNKFTNFFKSGFNYGFKEETEYKTKKMSEFFMNFLNLSLNKGHHILDCIKYLNIILLDSEQNNLKCKFTFPLSSLSDKNYAISCILFLETIISVFDEGK